jgi:hypothetical protein
MGCCNSCDEGHGCESKSSPDAHAPTKAAACCSSCGDEPHSQCQGETSRPSDPGFVGNSADGTEPKEQSAYESLRAGSSIQVATGLLMDANSANASQPLVLKNCNGGRIDVVVYGMTSQTTLEIRVEMGFTGENWSPVVSAYFQGTGSGQFSFRGVACPLVRFYYVTYGNANSKGLIAATVSGFSKN